MSKADSTMALKAKSLRASKCVLGVLFTLSIVQTGVLRG